MNESQDNKELSFEDVLIALETVVERISKQDMSLDDMIVMYEEGIQYLHLCRENLEAAEMKIQMLNARIKQMESGELQNG